MSVQLDFGKAWGRVRDFARTFEVRVRDRAHLTEALLRDDPVVGRVYGSIAFDPVTDEVELIYGSRGVEEQVRTLPHLPRNTEVSVCYVSLSEAMATSLYLPHNGLSRELQADPLVGRAVVGLQWSPDGGAVTVFLAKDLLERRARALAYPVEVRFRG